MDIYINSQKYVLGRPLVHPKSFYFVLIFFSLFATVLGVFKVYIFVFKAYNREIAVTFTFIITQSRRII